MIYKSLTVQTIVDFYINFEFENIHDHARPRGGGRKKHNTIEEAYLN